MVGVLPQSFDFGGVFAPGQKMDYFVPIIMDSISGWGHMLSLVGRLKPGVTLAQASGGVARAASAAATWAFELGDRCPYGDDGVEGAREREDAPAIGDPVGSGGS